MDDHRLRGALPGTLRVRELLIQERPTVAQTGAVAIKVSMIAASQALPTETKLGVLRSWRAAFWPHKKPSGSTNIAYMSFLATRNNTQRICVDVWDTCWQPPLQNTITDYIKGSAVLCIATGQRPDNELRRLLAAIEPVVLTARIPVIALVPTGSPPTDTGIDTQPGGDAAAAPREPDETMCSEWNAACSVYGLIGWMPVDIAVPTPWITFGAVIDAANIPHPRPQPTPKTTPDSAAESELIDVARDNGMPATMQMSDAHAYTRLSNPVHDPELVQEPGRTAVGLPTSILSPPIRNIRCSACSACVIC